VTDYDVLVIGGGFGGSVTALRLTEKGYRVGVLEAGRRFGPNDFADTTWDLRRWLYRPRLGLYGIQRIDLLSDVLVLSGAGVGGGSLVYANVLYEPHDACYEDPSGLQSPTGAPNWHRSTPWPSACWGSSRIRPTRRPMT
jgi:cholesterol oxidase